MFDVRKSKIGGPLVNSIQKLAAIALVNYHLITLKDSPVLIYQMGKVGSSSVYKSLKSERLRNPIFFVHFLSNDLIHYKQVYQNSGIQAAPYHLELGMVLRNYILKNKRKLKFKIISMVRDPIARQISDVFQNPEIMKIDIKNQNGLINKNRAMALIQENFSNLRTFDYIFKWFDREIKSVFGIDAFSKPFNRDSGWTIINGENAEVLVLRLENLSQIGPEVISDFLTLPNQISLVESNVRASTKDVLSYNYVKNNIRIDRSICREIYASRFCSHFYGDKEINKFMKRWAG